MIAAVPSQYYLPPIQRTFVWDEERIHKLFDSILRGYPIGTFLFWTTNDQVKLRKFIQNYADDIDLDLFRLSPNLSKKTLILDGQQRLQSLFVGLEGAYNQKELYFNPLTGAEVNPETGEKYKFRFFEGDEEKKGWVKFKDVFHQEPKANVIRNYILNALKSEGIALTQENENLVDANSSEILSKFMIEEALAYYEIDSITGLIKDQDEIHEIFVRANSGGVQLSKSDPGFLYHSFGVAGCRLEH